MIMKITFVSSTWDNCVRETHELTWQEFIGLFKEHLIIDNKNDVMMIIPASFKTEDYEPALDSDKNIKYREDGTPEIRRCKDNVDKVFMLPLDFDGDVTLEEAIERFRDYQYFAYTSYGHMTDQKEGKDAFRMFIPFKGPLTVDQYYKRRNAFRVFTGGDSSSVDIARGFYIPSHQAGRPHHYIWSNKGKELDALAFEEDEIPEVKPPVIMKTGVSAAEKRGKILWDTLDVVALFQQLGLYRKHLHGDTHEVVCPWVHEHSQGNDKGTVIFTSGGNKKAAFKCQHGHCAERRLFDVTQRVKEEQGMPFLMQFYEVIPYDLDWIKDREQEIILKIIERMKS